MNATRRDHTRGLYPFLGGEDRVDPTLDALRAVELSTHQKCADILALRRQVLEEFRDEIVRAGVAIATAVSRGGQLLAFGNGGSATDAQDAVADCRTPHAPSWRAVPALSLVDDVGVLTAVANDIGFEHVYARQIAAFARRGDVALAFSTSGNSPSVLAGLRAARKAGLVTVALAGYDGGSIARDGCCEHCIVARGEYVPRIQEAHATVWHALLHVVQIALNAGDA